MRNAILNHKCIVLIFSGVLLVFGAQGVSSGQTITASTPRPLTGATLHESVVTLTLSGGIYERARWDIADALAVSGIPGVTVGTFGPAWFGVNRVSNTKITVKLGFAGDMATDATLTFTVGAGAIANYNGPALTADVSVTNSNEPVEVPTTQNPAEQGPSPATTEKPVSIATTTTEIQGPWLWMVVPTGPSPGGGISTETDSLANASGGSITETHVARNGVNEGDVIGQLPWISSKIHWSDHQCREYDVERPPGTVLTFLTLATSGRRVY